MQLTELTTRYTADPSNPELVNLISRVDVHGSTADDAIRLWNTIIRIETAQSSRNLIIDAHCKSLLIIFIVRALVVEVTRNALEHPLDESALVRLFEMSVRTAKSFVNFDDNKVRSFMQLAEQFASQLDTNVLMSRKTHEKYETIKPTYLLLLLSIDKVKTFQKAKDIIIPFVQAEFIDGLLQLSMVRMHAKDYTVVSDWLSALIAWMPTALADDPAKRADVLTMLAESELAVDNVNRSLELTNQALATFYTVASFLVKLKATLVLSVKDIEIVDLFHSFKLTNERDSVFELFRMVADARSAELAFDCLQVAFPNQNALEDSIRQDLAIVKLTIAANDKFLPEDEKVAYTRSMLESMNLGKWSDGNRKALEDFINVQSEKCMKRNLFTTALKWLEMGKMIFGDDETSKSTSSRKLIQCFLEMGRLDEAEAEILNLSPNNIHGCILRIQLSIKRERLSDAIALINQMSTIDEVKTSHFLSLLEMSPELLKLHVLRAALSIEPGNLSIVKAILSLAATTNEIELKDKIEIILAYISQCDDDDLAKKITWNVGQLAIQNEMHADATILFRICFEKTPEDSVEERLLSSFFKCQSVYHNSKHVYTEMDVQDLERTRQLSETTFPKSRSKKSTPHVQDKQKLQQLLCLFTAKALINLSKWDDLRRIVENTSIERLISLILGSTINIPVDIHLSCLHKLMDSISDIKIDHFATLFRGTATAALLFDTNSAITYFRQAYSIVKDNEYPREESLWLCVTCFNTAMLMSSWKDRSKAQEWCELAISFSHCLHLEDRQIYEPRIRNGYSTILQSTK